MPYVNVPLSNGAAVSKSLPLSAQELTNWYMNIPESGGYSESNLFGTQGIKLILNTATGEINRGSHVMNEIPYFVNGNNLYKITRTVNAITGEETFSKGTTLGTITGAGFVSMADNGTQLVIVVPGSTSYTYNHVTDTFAAITDSTFTTTLGPSNSVQYIDGFFVHTSSKTNNEDTFFHSNLNDGLTYNALDFGTAAVDPDKIRAGHVYVNKFYALGSETIEVFDNVGGSGFVFARRDGFVIPKGLLARFSVVNYDGGFVFLGAGTNEQPAIWKLTGSTLDRISTTEIQDQIAKFTDTEISNAFSWVSGTGGAYFLNLTVGTKTFVYDSTASALGQKKIWFNKTSFINDVVGRNRVNSAVTAYGRVMVGDSNGGNIGELDNDTYAEYSEKILRVNSTQPLTNMNDPVNISSIELAIESGVGNTTVTDPEISLEISFDGGHTFNNARSRKMGKQGEWFKRCIWNMNGQLDSQSVFRFTMSDEVKPVLLKLIVWAD